MTELDEARRNGVATCRKCSGQFVPVAYQLVHADWICPACVRERGRTYRAARKAQGRPVVTGVMSLEWYRQYRATYVKKPESIERSRAYHRTKSKLASERPQYQARRKAYTELAAGRLTKKPCQQCGDPKVEAHHHDYSKPLDVTWLCRLCHRQLHARMRREAREPKP